MNEVETIHGQVISKANNYMIGSHGGIVKGDNVKKYERSFIRQCKIYKNKMIDCRFILHVVVYESSNAYDLDNSLKTILDCLQDARAITNDNLCVGIDAHKVIDRKNPRISFWIEELEPRLEFD